MNLTRRTYFGITGGILIMLSVFLTAEGAEFDTKALNFTENLLLFVAGIGVLVFARLGRRTLAAYSAVAATTLGTLLVIDLLRAGTLDLTVKLVALIGGIALALMASIGGDLMTYIAPTRDVSSVKTTRSKTATSTK
ncbi:MAG: hypothetical protein JW722_00075 [Demequinaceae bacterium]|nr:hypothetical protein [Demequinaceae bacterium]